MHGARAFIEALAIVLGVAAVTTRALPAAAAAGRARLPARRAHRRAAPADSRSSPTPEIVQTLSELGVILLMFSLGLEFSLRKLLRVGPTAGITAVRPVQPDDLARLPRRRGLRLDRLESAVRGRDHRDLEHHHHRQGLRRAESAGRLRELVVGVLIVEDLIAILLMAAAHRLRERGRSRRASLARPVGAPRRASSSGFWRVGLLVVPRAVRAIVRLGRAGDDAGRLGRRSASRSRCSRSTFGYSVALGAFLAGSLVAESGEATRRWSTWCGRCATSSPRSSSSRWGCSSTRS